MAHDEAPTKEERDGLREERDQVKFINLRLARRQFVVKFVFVYCRKLYPKQGFPIMLIYQKVH